MTNDAIHLRVLGEENIELSSEELRVIHAVSPTIEAEETEDGVLITVHDYAHTDTALVRKGIQGEKGDTGDRGPQGIQGEQGETGPQGPQGVQGEKGDTGSQGPQGEQGETGLKGDDGFSPTVSVTDIDRGHQVTITDAIGSHSFNVMDGSDAASLVKDVQVNGASVLSRGIANIPAASTTDLGAVRISSGLQVNEGIIKTDKALLFDSKAGTNAYKPIVPSNQHGAVFYGLAKAAGADLAPLDENTVTIGSYTSEAKAAIQNMLGTDALIGPVEPDIVADQAYAIGEIFVHNGLLYKATRSISKSGIINVGVNCEETTINEIFAKESEIPTKVSDLVDDSGHYTKPAGGIPASDLAVGVIPSVPVQDVQVNGTSIVSNGVANIQKASSNNLGVVGIEPQSGVAIASNGKLEINPASTADIKNGENTNKPIVPFKQDVATFYGLAKAAGDSTQSASANSVGTYTDGAKTAIQTMLDVPSNAAMTTAIGNAIGHINSFDMAVVQELPTEDISTHTIYLVPKTGETNDVYDEYIYVNNAWEMIGNTQIDLSNYVQKTDYANATTAGVVKVSNNGVGLNTNNILQIIPASTSTVKDGAVNYNPIVPAHQHEATFYGLAKAAGDSTQSASSNAVGTYTDSAKAVIQHMLGTDTIIAPYESDAIADRAYAVGEVFSYNGKLYKVTVAIAQDGVITPGTNCTETSVTGSFARDVRVNGTSVVTDGVANIPIGDNKLGAVIISGNTAYGLKIGSSGIVEIVPATNDRIKTVADYNNPIPVKSTHIATFYGLAKAAGDSTQSASDNAVGAYTDSAKDAIQRMLGVDALIATHDTATATAAHAINEVFVMDGKLYRATVAIAVGDTITVGTNCEEKKIDEVFVKNTDYATANDAGVVKVSNAYGLYVNASGNIQVYQASNANVKAGTESYKPVVPYNQHMAAFYGLAKAAGDSTQASSDNAVGTYTADAKAAIQTMLGVPGDVQINGTSIVNNGVANIPVAGVNTFGVVKVNASSGTQMDASNVLTTAAANDSQIKVGTQSYRPIVPSNQHQAVFYGLAKAAGDTTQSQSNNAVGTYTTEAKAAIQTMLGIRDQDWEFIIEDDEEE